MSPFGLIISGINQSVYNSSLYYVNVTWTPTLEQFGLNIFCFSATNSERSANCIHLLKIQTMSNINENIVTLKLARSMLCHYLNNLCIILTMLLIFINTSYYVLLRILWSIEFIIVHLFCRVTSNQSCIELLGGGKYYASYWLM